MTCLEYFGQSRAKVTLLHFTKVGCEMTGDPHRDYHEDSQYFQVWSVFFENFENFGKNVIFEKMGYRVQKIFCFRSWISFLTFGKTVKSG